MEEEEEEPGNPFKPYLSSEAYRTASKPKQGSMSVCCTQATKAKLLQLTISAAQSAYAKVKRDYQNE